MLVGRVAERQLIDQLVAGARIGNSGVLAITGEAGVGKTALLGYARSRFDGFQVLSGTGTEPEREIPFAGLLSLLRPVLTRLDSIPGPQAEALSAALALRAGTPGDRFAIGAATLSLLCRCAEEIPVAVVVDDLQWLDRPSAEAVAFAARRLSADPVAVLLAARTGESDDVTAGLPHLSVAGLEIGPAGDLVRSFTALPVTDEQLARLHQLTGGNPLAMLELGGDPALLAQTGPEVPPAVPIALLASYGKRIRALDQAARSALLVAVVANGDLRLTSAGCALLQLDPASLGQAEHIGMITVLGGQIEFRHPLVRAAIYADAAPAERRAAHRAVAGALPDYDIDLRAWHLSEASWSPDAEVADLMTLTAEHAAARTAYSVASTAYERAARLSPEPKHQLISLTRAAENAWAAGLVQRALGLLDELRGLPGNAEMGRADLQLRAAIAASTGSLVVARDLLEHAAVLEPDSDTTVMLLADALHATFYLADTDSSRRLAEKLTAALAKATSSQARALGLVATGMAKVLTNQGGVEELRSAVPLLAECTELRSDSRRPAWLMLAPLFLRDSNAAGRELRLVVDEVRNRAGVGELPNLLFHVARDQATTDSWTRAEANYSEAIRLARDTGQSTELAVSLAGLACLESRQGRAEACRTHAAEALPICVNRNIHLPEAWVHFALGDLELALGNTGAAVEQFLRLEGLLERLGLRDPDLSARPELADALLRLGRVEEARRSVSGYLIAADSKGQPWAAARAQRARGLVAPHGQFDEPFREALTIHAETLDTFETGRTHLAYGARLRRTGRRVDARAELHRALEIFTGLGAERWADQAAVELDATGERVPRRDPAGITSLTPQELQVSLLLAEGRTTRETAAALFLSPKTVEYHLRKVYTKLGIRSRAELAKCLLR